MRSIFLSLAFLLVALVTVSSIPAFAAASDSTAQTVTLRTLEGADVSLSELKGKPTVVAIGATWLPLSAQQAAMVNELKKTLGGNVNVVWVSVDSSEAKSKNYASDAQIKSFVQRTKLTARVLRDANGSLLKGYEVDQLPAFIVLDKQGNVVGAPIGGVESENNSIEPIVQRVNGLR